MVLFHGARSVRYVLKGYLHRFLLSKYPTVGTKVLTSRIYVGFRSLSTPFNHMNNAKFIEAFEFARWETLAASGFNEKAFRGKVYPVVASAQCSYFAQIPCFSFVTIQTALLGMTANGNHAVFVQHMYFDGKDPMTGKEFKNRLAATAIFHVSILDWKTHKSMPMLTACERMGTSPQEIFLLGDFQMNSIDDFFTTTKNEQTGEVEKKMNEKLEKLIHDAATNPAIDPSGFVAENPEHRFVAKEALLANASATARVTQAAGPQRNWFRMETKSESKKKNVD